MKSSYAVAYKDKEGKDFNGLPWILDDIKNREDCKNVARRLHSEGYVDVTPFQFSEKRKSNLEFDWNYVKYNEIRF